VHKFTVIGDYINPEFSRELKLDPSVIFCSDNQWTILLSGFIMLLESIFPIKHELDIKYSDEFTQSNFSKILEIDKYWYFSV